MIHLRRAPAAIASCPGSGPSYTVLDLTGDHRPDVVATCACDDATVGSTHWRVHAGTCV